MKGVGTKMKEVGSEVGTKMKQAGSIIQEKMDVAKIEKFFGEDYDRDEK